MIARNTNLSYVYDTRGYVVVTCRIIDLSLMLQKFQWVVIYFPIALHEPCKFFFEGKCIRLITILIWTLSTLSRGFWDLAIASTDFSILAMGSQLLSVLRAWVQNVETCRFAFNTNRRVFHRRILGLKPAVIFFKYIIFALPSWISSRTWNFCLKHFSSSLNTKQE